MRPFTRILLYLLVTTVVEAACTERPSPMAPAPSELSLIVGAASAPCPSMDDACAEIELVVHESCPADGSYEHRNDYKNCISQAFNIAMRTYQHCFSQEEKKLIRKCVFDDLGIMREEGDDPQIHDEPHDPTKQLN